VSESECPLLAGLDAFPEVPEGTEAGEFPMDRIERRGWLPLVAVGDNGVGARDIAVEILQRDLDRRILDIGVDDRGDGPGVVEVGSFGPQRVEQLPERSPEGGREVPTRRQVRERVEGFQPSL
jgi:hypothetical protein